MLNDLSRSVAEIDEQYSSSPSPSLFKEKLRLQTEYDLLSMDKATQLILKARHNSYEYGDKASKLLAHQIRQNFASRLITKIEDSAGNIVINHEEINDIFKQFYAKLYTSESHSNISQKNSFLDKLSFPTVPPENLPALDAEISIIEIKETIKSLRSNKTPGPDGYGAEFYKKFVDKFSPLL